MTYTKLGVVQDQASKADAAMESFGRALAIRKRLAEQNPESPDVASDVGGALNNIAMLDLSRERYGDARKNLEAAIACQRKALERSPNHPQYRQFLANHLANLIRAANGMRDTKAATEARRALDELKASERR
jgi:tetratricopeptide (TPR) repeat protein